jgi:hypothetical protein
MTVFMHLHDPGLTLKPQNLLKHADLLIIVDPNDYGKSCLVDSRDFGKASDSFARLYSSSQAESQGCASEQGLTALLLFSSTGPMPEFHPMLIDCSHAKLTQTFEPQEQPKARRQKAERMRVKLESDPTPANNVKSDQTSSSEKRSTPTCTDWAKASDSLLRIITRVRAHGVSKTEPATALPQIEGIIRIAQKYDVIHAVQSDFDSLFFGYVGSGKFWELIAQEPVRCLKIGIALKNLPVYEEAFKHLVGIGANSKTGVHLDGLPDEIQAIVHHRSWELYGLRRDVNEDLLLISLAVGEDDAESTPPPEYQSSTVNQNYNPDAYSTVNIVRDWMAEHIGYLRCETSRASRPYYLCDHGSGCNTVAGFYRAIAAGRDAYLLFDMVWDTFNKDFLEKEDHDQERDQFNPEVVKSPLDALKKKASEYVGALVKSTLHLPSKDELDYLTCVTVESEDVPWDVSGKGGEGEDSDGD